LIRSLGLGVMYDLDRILLALVTTTIRLEYY